MIKVIIYPMLALCAHTLWASDVVDTPKSDFIQQKLNDIKNEADIYEQSLQAHVKCCLCNLKKYLTGDTQYRHVKTRIVELNVFKSILKSKDHSEEKKIELLLKQLSKMNDRQVFDKYSDINKANFGQNFYNRTKNLLEKCQARLLLERALPASL